MTATRAKLFLGKIKPIIINTIPLQLTFIMFCFFHFLYIFFRKEIKLFIQFTNYTGIVKGIVIGDVVAFRFVKQTDPACQSN